MIAEAKEHLKKTGPVVVVYGVHDIDPAPFI